MSYSRINRGEPRRQHKSGILHGLGELVNLDAPGMQTQKKQTTRQLQQPREQTRPADAASSAAPRDEVEKLVVPASSTRSNTSDNKKPAPTSQMAEIVLNNDSQQAPAEARLPRWTHVYRVLFPSFTKGGNSSSEKKRRAALNAALSGISEGLARIERWRRMLSSRGMVLRLRKLPAYIEATKVLIEAVQSDRQLERLKDQQRGLMAVSSSLASVEHQNNEAGEGESDSDIDDDGNSSAELEQRTKKPSPRVGVFLRDDDESQENDEDDAADEESEDDDDDESEWSAESLCGDKSAGELFAELKKDSCKENDDNSDMEEVLPVDESSLPPLLSPFAPPAAAQSSSASSIAQLNSSTLPMIYATAISRAVCELTEGAHGGRKFTDQLDERTTFRSRSQAIALPEELAEARNQIAHGRMPTLSQMRFAASLGLQYLYEQHWVERAAALKTYRQVVEEEKRIQSQKNTRTAPTKVTALAPGGFGAAARRQQEQLEEKQQQGVAVADSRRRQRGEPSNPPKSAASSAPINAAPPARLSLEELQRKVMQLQKQQNKE